MRVVLFMQGQDLPDEYKRRAQAVIPGTLVANGQASSSFSGRWDPTLSFQANQLRTARSGNGLENLLTLPQRLYKQMLAAQNAPGRINPTTGAPYSEEDFNNQNQYYEDQPYLGGYPDDYISQGEALSDQFGRMSGLDNQWRMNMLKDSVNNTLVPVRGKPLYREGAQSSFARNLTVDQIRQWQSFFQMQGFKTGPAGFWTSYEQDAMKQFMIMANGTPGGGMKVETLRDKVLDQVESGILRPGELAGMIGGELNQLGQSVIDGTDLPYTETTVQKNIDQISSEQGLLVLRQFWQQQYGRDPSSDELSAWVKKINGAMRADPTVITTVVTHDPTTGTTDTEQTTDESEVDVQGSAFTQAKEEGDQEERYEYQASRYVDALMNAIG